MTFIVTSIHDPIALAANCARLHLPAPDQGQVRLDGDEVHGWIIHLPGLHSPIVCNTLTGLVAYHPSDNGFSRQLPPVPLTWAPNGPATLAAAVMLIATSRIR
jgi:hypothetical protein